MPDFGELTYINPSLQRSIEFKTGSYGVEERKIDLSLQEATNFKVNKVQPIEFKKPEVLESNKWDAENKYPTDYIRSNIEFAKRLTEQRKYGKLGQFVLTQAGFYALNPIGAQIINPVVAPGIIPGEGIIRTTFFSENTAIKLVREPKESSPSDREKSAIAGGTLGQEEGSLFKQIASPLGNVINTITGIIKTKDNNNITSPKVSNLEKRLRENDLSPERQKNPANTYDKIYSLEKLSGVKIKDLEQGFTPIQDSEFSESKFLDDVMLRDNLEKAFDSNAPTDKRNRSFDDKNGKKNLLMIIDQTANAANEEEPAIQGSGMIFPFYFESMNFFPDNLEKYISFQATFNGLKESYKPQRTAKMFFGRSTPIYTYESTDRTISFNFFIWAPNRISLGLLKQRTNWLARHCYPSYKNLKDTQSKIIFEAPVIKFTIGDLFRNVPGIIQSLDYDWDERWELSKNIIMPQAVKVSISITILHDKFMQNAETAKFNKFESSDFYEFIHPPNVQQITY